MSTSAADPVLDPESIDVSEQETVVYLALPPGARARAARLRVTGVPYLFWEDLFQPEWGATVSPPLEGALESLVVDFHGLRAVDKLRIAATWSDATSRYCRLQPWAGITWYQPQPAGSYILPKSPGLVSGTTHEAGFPELEIQKLMISFHATNTLPTSGDWAMAAVTPSALALHCRSTPSNLSLRVGGGSPVWTYNGPLSKALVTPDLAGALNDYLAANPPAAGAQEQCVPLFFQSATLGHLTLAAEELDVYYVLDRFADGSDAVTLSFECDAAWTGATAVTLPAGATVQKAEMTLSADFAADRLLDDYAPASLAPSAYSALVSEEQWAAAPLALDAALALSGVDLPLSALADAAGITAELQVDINGVPSGTPIDLGEGAAAAVQVDVSPDGGTPHWYCLDMPSPIATESGEGYWLVLKGTGGRASWHAGQAQPGTLRYSKDGGASWIPFDLAAWGGKGMGARLRLRYLPAGASSPVSLRAGTIWVDLGALVTAGGQEAVVDLCSVLGPGAIPLEVTALARGQVTLSRLYVEYALGGGGGGTPRPPLGALDVEVLDGIGGVYAGLLHGAGIDTLETLADVDRQVAPVGLSRTHLFELQGKARAALDAAGALQQFAALSDCTLGELLSTPPDELAVRMGLPRRQARQMAVLLRTLQMSLDTQVFSRMRLRSFGGEP